MDSHLEYFCELDEDVVSQADVIFEVEDEVLPVHKCFLVANSKVFMKMLMGNGNLLSEGAEPMKIKNLFKGEKAKYVRLMLCHFYDVNRDVKTMKDAVNLARLAHKFDAQRLERDVKDFISSSLSYARTGKLVKLDRDIIEDVHVTDILNLACVCHWSDIQHQCEVQIVNRICDLVTDGQRLREIPYENLQRIVVGLGIKMHNNRNFQMSVEQYKTCLSESGLCGTRLEPRKEGLSIRSNRYWDS